MTVSIFFSSELEGHGVTVTIHSSNHPAPDKTLSCPPCIREIMAF
jgi:hypothetical protein